MLTKLKLNRAGVNSVLHSAGVRADLKARADKVAATAGAGLSDPEGMTVVDASDKNRARFIVLTTDAEAMVAEMKDRALTRAIDAAR